MINVDILASTAAFVGTVYLIAVRRSVSGRTGCRRCGRVGKLSETEWRTAIRQTVPTKASVEAETSTLIKNGCVIIEFHIELGTFSVVS